MRLGRKGEFLWIKTLESVDNYGYLVDKQAIYPQLSPNLSNPLLGVWITALKRWITDSRLWRIFKMQYYLPLTGAGNKCKIGNV